MNRRWVTGAGLVHAAMIDPLLTEKSNRLLRLPWETDWLLLRPMRTEPGARNSVALRAGAHAEYGDLSLR